MDIKKRLKKGDITIGSWITLGHPAIAEIMAKAGFDWLVVDLEHSVITIREAEEVIRVIDLCGVEPLVRLSSNNSVQIKRVMDAGAHGVVVPMVNSAEEAEEAVRAVYYPPKGKRGVGLARAQGYGASFEDYKEWLHSEPLIIVQVEHIHAVENLEDILSVEDIDGFIVGPYDLSASLGIPGDFRHSLMQEAMQQIEKVAREFPKARGIHVVEPSIEDLQQKIEEGYRFIAYSIDIRILDTSCRFALSAIL